LVRVFETRVRRWEVARRVRGRGAISESLRKNNAIPVEVATGDMGTDDRDVAAKRLRTRSSRRGSLARACRDGDQAGASRNILAAWIRHEIGGGEGRVDDTGSASDHGRPFTGDIPGKAQPWRKVLILGLPDGITNPGLTLLHQPDGRKEVTNLVVRLMHR